MPFVSLLRPFSVRPTSDFVNFRRFDNNPGDLIVVHVRQPAFDPAVHFRPVGQTWLRRVPSLRRATAAAAATTAANWYFRVPGAAAANCRPLRSTATTAAAAATVWSDATAYSKFSRVRDPVADDRTLRSAPSPAAAPAAATTTTAAAYDTLWPASSSGLVVTVFDTDCVRFRSTGFESRRR